MARLAQLPSDTIFFTQITMEAAEDTEFLDAMRSGQHQGRTGGSGVGDSGGFEGRLQGVQLRRAQTWLSSLRTFRRHGVYVLGSFIFGLPSDRPETFDATAMAAAQAEVAFAQFVMLTPYPGTVDFKRWEKNMEAAPVTIAGIPITRRWLIPPALRPKLYWPHPTMSAEEIRQRTQSVWDTFYSLKYIWARSGFIKSMRRAAGVRPDFENLPADVCRHRNRHRQCASLAIRALGPLAGQAVSAVVCGSSDA